MTFSFNAKDYEAAKRSFSIPVPEFFNFGFDVIDRHAADEKKRALVWVDPAGKETRTYTFRDISRLSNQAANALREMGVRKGDRVFIMLGRVLRSCVNSSFSTTLWMTEMFFRETLFGFLAFISILPFASSLKRGTIPHANAADRFRSEKSHAL